LLVWVLGFCGRMRTLAQRHILKPQFKVIPRLRSLIR
jgi:hypothetical protein